MTPALLTSRPLRLVLAAAVLGGHAFAQAPAPAPVRPVPPPGVQLPDGDRAELQAGVVALGKDITILRHNLQSKPEMLALLPDVLIFHKAVNWALRYNEFFNVKQVATAKKLLELGNQRLAELKDGKPSWISATGLVPRGYISKIDGSVQPYGMVIPDDWKADEKTPRRLDFWCHGRGETLSELDFLNQRITSKGEYTPAGTLVLHLYGRYCCANKFAGETDLFEALENAKTHYKIDSNKLVVRGFSMGGGSTWQFGTHFAGLWAAINPGAGFGDTKEFMKLGTTPEKPLPPEWEQTLWKWYDSAASVSNLANTTTVAYSGEIDGQKQAADIMIRFARQEAGNAHPPIAVLNKVEPGDGSSKAAEARVTGTAPDVAFYHVIGLQVPHKIKPEAKPEVDSLVDAAVAKHEAVPKKVHFTTYTLVYPTMSWITVMGMEKQWERADVDAEIVKGGVKVETKNVTHLTVNLPGETFPAGSKQEVIIDGTHLPLDLYADHTPHWWNASLRKEGGHWTAKASVKDGTKSALLCGPIDHAFMSSFVNVRPTGKPLNDKVGAWAKSELEHAIGFWRKVYRGEAPVKDDTAITNEDIANSNLILWGDPSSNAVLKKIIAKLPVQWSATQLTFGGKNYEAAHTAPVMIFPNPLNPTKYVVLNSGVTFREQALLNNADQTPKLPDWAIIDLNTAPDAKWPGEVKAAGFFDEQWKVSAK
ncbi:MAG: prolyl oligopeptidase family serine peptidase [Chthoniobacter sp.]|uniref:prolyl oligopeptidase family serine peptidase n=1 Tax=Chthoniobacter sp. TaxID=2510640 RepID=UPI0032A592C5